MAKKKPIDISKLKDAKTQFIKALNAVYDKELAAKIAEVGKGAELTKDEISGLRNHPDLGLWNSNGKPISIEGVRAHFRWRDQNQAHRKKTSPLTLKEVKPEQIEGYTRPYLESQKSITREANRWIKRLNGEEWRDRNGKLHPATGVSSWPPGLTEKNIFHEIDKAAKETGEYNAKLAAETGFSFQKGHGWGVMGPANKRTWVVPYFGSRMEGHFNYRNVAPQPSGETFKRLLHPFWNAIIPNVPSRYSKHGVQISSADELRWAGGGGQGWSGTMADILLRAVPDANIDDFDQLPLDQKAYVLFGDPDKGGGANPEARYFEIKNGQWPKVLKRVSHFASTSEQYMPRDAAGNLINKVKKYIPHTEEWNKLMSGWDAPSLFNIAVPTTAIYNMVKGAKTMAAGIAPDVRDALNPEHAVNLAQAQTRISEGENPLTVIKEEGSESLGVLKQDLFDNAKWASALMVASKIPGGAKLAVGGARVLANPFVGIPLLATGAYKFADTYFEAKRDGYSLTDQTADFFHQDPIENEEGETIGYKKREEVEERKWEGETGLKHYFANRNKNR